MSPRQSDNPLRLARVRAGVPQATLAKDLGVSRSTLQAIEEGRTREPSRTLLWRLDNACGLPTGTLEGQLQRWHATRTPLDRLTHRQRAILDLPASAITRDYDSFVAWRRELASSPTAFASLIGVDRAKVSAYESGIRVNGMPDTLATALVQALGISDAYLVALQRLEPSDD